ncbi:MAG TPA: SMC-Scp complex subunit ScpB [Firmicutes bacterium]|jgi:segregation and condensation protein B|nr:SMC-Scp complex subunit ScpB [Bacillota bacterium]
MVDKGNLSAEALLEAALFLSQEPLSIKQLALVCQAQPGREVRNVLERLGMALEKNDRGLTLLESAEGYQLGTKPGAAAHLEVLFSEDRPEAPLSQAALETLSIIAFRQPVTRIEIETIRGVKVDGVLDNLLKRQLIRVSGRKEGLGRPLLYVTTPEFLHYFGLKDLEELEMENRGEEEL